MATIGETVFARLIFSQVTDPRTWFQLAQVSKRFNEVSESMLIKMETIQPDWAKIINIYLPSHPPNRSTPWMRGSSIVSRRKKHPMAKAAGNLTGVSWYLNGNKHGLCQGWHINGKLHHEGKYKYGNTITYKVWNEWGQLIVNYG